MFEEFNSPLPMIPPLKGLLEITYATDHSTIGLSCELAANQNRVDTFEDPTPGYAVMNTFVQKIFMFSGFVHNLSLSIDNIFNQEYRNHLSRIKIIMPDAGRNFQVTYRIFY